eukprot:TRINITY_DN1064_c6_g1_i1.p1 TRINITY_DN1064_c6_g1~~TRINITY_DN1064_c6_g1_i1.p1  ORF type:complete len:274 (+),score=88.05 TRINITY_DN1064_c6_g1_i1:61-822(+)
MAEGGKRKRQRQSGPEDDAAAAAAAAAAAPGKAGRVTVVDAFEGGQRTVKLQLRPGTRTKTIKESVAKQWSDWRSEDMVLVVSGNDAHAGRALADEEAPGSLLLGADITLMLFHKGQQREAFSRLREEQQKEDEYDQEDHGDDPEYSDAKVRVAVAERAPGQLNATLTWKGEEHTLGNALRHVLMRDRRVLQCGYTIPHPLEDRMQMDICAREYPPALVCEALSTLSSICEKSADRFQKAYAEYSSGGDAEMS